MNRIHFNIRVVSRAILTILLTVVTSCGPQLLNPLEKTVNLPVTVMNAETICSSQEEDVFVWLGQQHQKHSAGIGWLARLEALTKAVRPRLISRKDLRARAEALKQSRLSTVSITSFDQVMGLREELKQLNDTFNEYQRLRFLECNMQNFWEQGKLPFSEFMKLVEGDRSLENTQKVCASLKSPALCHIEIRRAARDGQLDAIATRLKFEFSQRYFEPRFRITSPKGGIVCEKQDDRHVLKIPVSVNPNDKQLLQNSLRIWNSEHNKLAIEIFDSSTSDALEIVHMNGGPSYVDMEKRDKIHLAPGHNHPLIVAHELGHVLGFPDCYHEGWSNEEQGFVYLELDIARENLMCTIDPQSIVPKKYFEDLKSRYCRN